MRRMSAQSNGLGARPVLVLLLLLTSAWLLVLGSTIGFDAAFTSSASPFAVVECDALCTSPDSVALTVTLVRSGDLTGTDTVYVSTRVASSADVLSATAPDDYTPLSAVPVVFSPSDTVKTVPVTIISDGIYEEDEQFEAFLLNPSSGATLSASAQVAYINIQDGGDAGIFSFSASSYTFAENAGLVSVKIVRTGGASGQVQVLYRLANPTQATAANNKNFRLTDSVYQAQFDEGQCEGFISFTIINDAVYEAKEFFYLEISSMLPTKASDQTTSVAKFGTTRTAIIFIADDGDAGVFNFASPFIFCREDNGSALLTVLRSQGSSSSSYMPVNFVITTIGTTGGSNATEGGSLAFDYLAKSDKLNWANGELRKTFAVKIFNNNRYEARTRAVKVKMSSVEGGASIGAQFESWIYIIDDRDAGTLSFKRSSYEVLENGGSVTVEILRTGVVDLTNINTYASGTVTVNVSTYAGTILPGQERYDLTYDYDVVRQRGCTHTSPCTAPEGIAYTPLQTTTITFADGETSKTVMISILDDDVFQAPDRVFKLILQHVAGGAHIGVDYEHPSEWYGYREIFLELEKTKADLLDNVGTIVIIKDNSDPAVLVSKASLSTSEIGQYDSFQVWLNSQPSADVTITFNYDLTLLELSLPKLIFTATNWKEKQLVTTTAIPNSKSEGLHRTEIKMTCISTDTKYASPFLIADNVAGAVLALGVFTQKRGEYDTGNTEHQFLWSEPDGVLTAPVTDNRVAVYIFDNKHAGVAISPEAIRHGSGSNAPDNYVSVRRNGHDASVNISLTSEPAADVRATLVPEILSGIVIEPPYLTIGTMHWEDAFEVKITAVEVVGQAEPEAVQFSAISVVVTSAGDPLYNRPSSPIGRIFVQRFPPALVLLDSSVVPIREGAGEREMVLHSINLGSEPMHWEPVGSVYSPHEVVLSAEADTTLLFPPPVGSGFGGASTITVAGNSSKSTTTRMTKSLGVLRFKVHPEVVSSTGSSQVGSARLRLFRVSEGENGGLGGIRVGVCTASVDTSEGWDESGLQSKCSDTLENSGVCSVSNATMDLPSFFPLGSTIYNIDSQSDGEILITPSEGFDKVTNSYIATSGWVEIDVTYAVNGFLSGIPKSSAAKAITFLVYSRSAAGFTYGGVDEMVFASREYADSGLRPQLRVTSSGTVNLAQQALVSQSCPGNAKAAIDGKTSSKLSLSSSYALSATPCKYPWWEADLTAARAIENIIITVKAKPSAANMDDSYLKTSFWVFLSTMSLTSGNNGLTGFANAKAKALYARQFNVTTRSFAASEAETITFGWHVNGEETGAFASDRFIGDYSKPVEIRFVLIQVGGENNIMLNEVEIYQQAFAGSRVSIGGFMPSLSQSRLGMNQLQFLLPGLREADLPECDATTAICRRELIFTSGNWKTPQLVGVKVFDDTVTMGDHEIYATHTPESNDPDFDEPSKCGAPSGNLECKNTFFNDSGVKPIRVLEDDENKILLSKHSLEITEGSQNFPTAPVYARQAILSPPYFRCSSSPDLLNATASAGLRNCMSSFSSGTSSPWEMCIANSSASPLDPGSAWMMAGFAPGAANISRIDVTVPRMAGAKYIKRFSVWWNSSKSLVDTASGILDLSDGWKQIKTVDITMKSSGVQSFVLDKLALFPVQALLVTLEKSYDETKQCMFAPQIRISGFEPVPFPLTIRGDLNNPDNIPPSLSRLSRMHLYGKSAVVQVQLASEPIGDVVVSVVLDDANDAVVVYDAANTSNVPESVHTLVGSLYESGKTWEYTMATAIKFTPENWNIPQGLTFIAVDDNFFNGNRILTITHIAESNEGEALIVPLQTFDGLTLEKELTTLSPELSYSQAEYIVSDCRLGNWPYHYDPAWKSSDGSIGATVIDDDLPGVTITSSVVRISESGPSGNFSVFLDSAPFEDVVVKISYERDDALFLIMPTQLKFTVTNWYEPQFVFVHPVPNDVYDGEQPYTIDYERLIPKAKKPILVLKVESVDASYNGIRIGGNEDDRTKLYVVNQGIQVVVLDDDTGCLGEYTCQKGGTCMNSTSGNVCKCSETFGMRNCSAACENKRDCAFRRVSFRLKCHPQADNAICGSSVSASSLVSTLYRMLGSDALTTVSGKTFPKLSLRPMSELIYVVNSSQVACVDGSGDCVAVWVDFQSTVLEKLDGLLASGSLKAEPVYAELMVSEPQYPADLGSTVAVWVFIGFCALCVTAVGGLFMARLLRAKTSHVTPRLDDEEPTHATGQVTSPTSPRAT